MPTGYTNELVEKDLDFPTWALVCSRALGVCVMMRDDPIDKLPPEEFEVERYHLDELEKLCSTLLHMKSLKTVSAKKAWAREKLEKEFEYYTKVHEEELKKDAINKYKKMLAKVEAWEPPTPEHEGLKKFMIEQLDSSIKWDTPCDGISYNLDAINKTKARMEEPLEYFKEAFEKVEEDIKYHTKKYEEEVERTRSRNKWLKDLRESLKNAS